MDGDGATASTARIQAYHDAVDQYLLQAILSSVLCAVSFVLSIVSLGVLYKRGIKQRSVQVLLVATTVMTVSTILFYASAVTTCFIMNKVLATQLAGASVDSDEAASLTHTLYTISMISTNALLINVTVGDAVVVWRAVALCNYNKILRLGGMVMVAAIGVLGLIGTVWAAPGNLWIIKVTVDPALRLQPVSGWKPDTPAFVSLMLTLVTNVIATALITYKAWVHWRTILRSLSGCGGVLPRALHCLVLLIETGVVYSLLWVYIVVVYYTVVLTPSINSSKFEVSGAVFMTSCLTPIVAIYPMAIIVIFAMNQSPLEELTVLTTIPFDTGMTMSMSVFHGEDAVFPDGHGKAETTD
ncbi:uncharacterized protein BXZ73DRAFT_99929 [Epithele typhae]|uniref:uncharacterized protein n=1 Tax=Epithele typhae TaxID=378194 RepID=UPI002008C2EC|nr:uncharacterized protein BXZ73DRAFT_99929 [Epithele typhae]KAH9938867.1 hypothetical protein BXZ73DRAFT_99929 [Epithele typhae]